MGAGLTFTLLVLLCPVQVRPSADDCVAITAEVSSAAECRAVYQQIKATLPEGLKLGYPECARRVGA